MSEQNFAVITSGPFEIRVVKDQQLSVSLADTRYGSKSLFSMHAPNEHEAGLYSGALAVMSAAFDPFTVLKVAFATVEQNVHELATTKGWWDGYTASPDQQIVRLALVITEVAEAIEAVRNHNPESTKIPGFSLLEEELADALIRIFDIAGKGKLRLAEALVAKHHYNGSRAYRHGGKAA